MAAPKDKENLLDPMRFRPSMHENSRLKITRHLGLCKSCGECVVKCPVNAIGWDQKELGQLGEPAIIIDLNKCIGCELCEQICPDHAIEITNKPRPKDAPPPQKGAPDPISEYTITR